MPLSFSGFGPTAILIMLLCLAVSEIYKRYDKHHRQGTK
jgi:hypothetical protein